MLLYKYCAPERLDVLKNGLIRFSPVLELNDPFEAMPDSALLDNPGFKATIEHDVLRDMIAWQADMMRIYPAWKPATTAEILKNHRDKAERMRRDFSNLLMRSFREAVKSLRVLCLSGAAPDTPESILMWGHYTSGHRGFVLEFDGGHPWFHLNEQSPGDDPQHGISDHVSYPDKRLEYTGTEAVRNLVLSKSIHWAYEKEYRAIRIAGSTVLEGNSLGRYPSGALRSVTLGCNAEGLLESVREILRNNRDLHHVRLRKASIHPDEFRFVIADT